MLTIRIVTRAELDFVTILNRILKLDFQFLIIIKVSDFFRKVFVGGSRQRYGGWHGRIESLQVWTLDFRLGLGLGL